jgi:hypothetical protein
VTPRRYAPAPVSSLFTPVGEPKSAYKHGLFRSNNWLADHAHGVEWLNQFHLRDRDTICRFDRVPLNVADAAPISRQRVQLHR